MRAAVVIVAVAMLALASARCPNSCSGHGDCGGSDKCTCWANWQGFDCAERTCEFDVAWATDARQNPHYYAECSGKGICDRTTGLCTCFDGYTGSACRRSVCPNDCSGHGKCRLIAELGNANSALSAVDADASTDGSLAQYGRWDGDKIQACVCDGGFFGPDCSQRNCPKGDDPLTICDDATQQVQTLEISSLFDDTPRTEQEVRLTAAIPGLPIKGLFDLVGGIAGTTASDLDAGITFGDLDTALTGATVTGTSPVWVLTTAAEEELIVGSTDGTFPLYSPTGAITTNVVTDVLTIELRRTLASEAIAGSIQFSLDGFTTSVTIAVGANLAATLANFGPASGGAFTTYCRAHGFSADPVSIASAPGGSGAEEGDIIVTFDNADVLVTATIDDSFFSDRGTAYGTAPTIAVTYVNGAAGAFNALTDGTFRGELVLHFTDSEGEVWTTGRIGDATSSVTDFFSGSGASSKAQLEAALAAIPNFKVPAVTVTSDVSDTVAAGSVSHSWEILFKNERNSGTQNLLACDPLPLGCQSAGCSPMYRQPKTWKVGSITPSSWTAAHTRVEYARNPVANAFDNAPTWDDSVADTATVFGTFPSRWSASTGFDALFTSDSIFDNSNLPVDQATVLVRVFKVAYSASGNWGAVASDRHVYYTVEWDYTSEGVGSRSSLPTTTCGLDGQSCASSSTNGYPNVIAARYIPTGLQDGAQTANGLSDAGVGYNRVPIGNGLYINLGNALAGLSSAGTYHEQLYLSFDVATVRCSVTDVAPSPQYEHLECSGRGSCDRTTGSCTCFEGHYGDHCGMQTILV